MFSGLGVDCAVLYMPGDEGYTGAFGDCTPGGGGGYSGGDTTGGGTSSGSWWDNFLKAMGIASQTAIQIAKVENQMYYTPNGMSYPIGTGPYSGYTASQLQNYANQSNAVIGSSGGIILLGVAVFAVVLLARRR